MTMQPPQYENHYQCAVCGGGPASYNNIVEGVRADVARHLIRDSYGLVLHTLMAREDAPQNPS